MKTHNILFTLALVAILALTATGNLGAIMPPDAVAIPLAGCLLVVGVALLLWPHRSELVAIAAFFWLRLCGAWRMSWWAVAGVAAVYAVCFFGDFVDPTLRQFASWHWSKLVAWVGCTGLTCAALNSVSNPNPPEL